MQRVDVVIIGAGVVGCACARELSKTKAEVLVLEAAHDLGEGSSKANSGVVHVGFQPRGGSLKGVSCAMGNRRFDQLSKELEFPFKRVGAMMVAFNDEGISKLHEKAARALKNGCGVLPIVSGDDARTIEPRLSEKVIAAMLAPETGIVTPFDMVYAMAQNAHANSVRFSFNSKVVEIERDRGGNLSTSMRSGKNQNSGWILHLESGEKIYARYVLNMAGDEAAFLDSRVHPADYEVRPRAGDFVVFDKQEESRAITHVIYQAAETDEGGTLISPTVEGNLLVGPTSRDVRRFDDTASSAKGIAHVLRVAKKLIPDLDERDVITNFAGVRTNIVNVSKELKDFVVRISAPGFVSALGIKNPGLTASPILAERAVALLAEQGLDISLDPAFNPKRKRYIPFLKRDENEQKTLLDSDFSHARVVCRCEGVTEGDIISFLKSPLPPSTISGIKKRLRCGMGRCQGSYCMPRVAETIAATRDMSVSDVLYGETGGRVVMREVK